MPGSLITTAVDVYAFGILVYEFYTATKAYGGQPRENIISGVLRHGLRPRFPVGTPLALTALAAACWAHVPEMRPCFDDILTTLRLLSDQLAAHMPHAAAP